MSETEYTIRDMTAVDGRRVIGVYDGETLVLAATAGDMRALSRAIIRACLIIPPDE